MISSERATEGLTPEFLNGLRNRIRSHILDKAESYFKEDGTAYTQNNPALKRAEMVVNFYDYQPCCASVLGAMAAEGNERALILVRRLFNNTQYYIGEGRQKEGFKISLRRAQLHLALAYERLKTVLPSEEIAAWTDLLFQTGQDMLDHFNGFQEKRPALDNRGFGTGINHVAIGAEGFWKTGQVLNRTDWRNCAGTFIDRLVAYGHPDGYFEEHTNDAREGGPSLVYTPLTAGCAFIVQRWRNALNRERFVKCGTFFRNFMDSHLHALPFADERANPHGLGCYGIALHALSPEGRGLIRLSLDETHGTVNLERMSLEYLARLNFEIDHMETGSGAVPEPFQNGTFRITLPMAVARSHGWTLGLSALKALNRDIAPNSDYALDRQTLIFVSHQQAGTIVSGTKSKYDPLWSTVRKNKDAYPVNTGELTLSADRTEVKVYYTGFTVNATWIYGDQPRLILTSDSAEPLTTQLVLEAPLGTPLTVDATSHTFGEEETTMNQVQSVATEKWAVQANQPGRLIWYAAPFNPYSTGNQSAPTTRRPVFAVEWTGRVEFTFTAHS